MVRTRYLIGEAAKEVQVENHVLRYWEEELQLPVKRNSQGHRYYTREDVDRFLYVKELKSQGLQLKAIRTLLEEKEGECPADCEQERRGESSLLLVNSISGVSARKKKENPDITDDISKAHRLQILLQAMISEAVSQNNTQMCDEIKEIVQKEMDYQFRMQTEREEAKENERKEREEEHYKRIDELLRERGAVGEIKRKKHLLW